MYSEKNKSQCSLAQHVLEEDNLFAGRQREKLVGSIGSKRLD